MHKGMDNSNTICKKMKIQSFILDNQKPTPILDVRVVYILIINMYQLYKIYGCWFQAKCWLFWV